MAIVGLGHRLAAVRNMARLSQEEMSQKLGISRSAYQNYERGQRDLTAQLLLKVYEKFDVDPLWMLEGDTEDGKNRRHEQIASANRKIGIAVERRIIERGLTVTPEKNGTPSISSSMSSSTPIPLPMKAMGRTPLELTAY